MRLPDFMRPVMELPFAPTALGLLALLLAALVATWVTRRLLLKLLDRLVRASPMKWDDALLKRGALSRLSHAVPALIVHRGIASVPGLPPTVVVLVLALAAAYVAVSVERALGSVLDALNDLYEKQGERARKRPIKGYVQVTKLMVYVLAIVLVIALFFDRSPLLVLSGFGALGAVLMLIFKDTILSLVASVQLSSNDMLRVGDWIEMPALQADGDVIDMALHTVKVQNFDRTITTVPTHRLISDSFKNWRGMQEWGGRRIKRALLIDQTSVHFLTSEERGALGRIALIEEYLDRKQSELNALNASVEGSAPDPINAHRLTNLGTFRAYVEAYLRAHPGLNGEMAMLVRQLAPGATGLPLEIYCFTKSVEWTAYENTQSDIFDHLVALLPEFGLRIYQQPSGADVIQAAR